MVTGLEKTGPAIEKGLLSGIEPGVDSNGMGRAVEMGFIGLAFGIEPGVDSNGTG